MRSRRGIFATTLPRSLAFNAPLSATLATHPHTPATSSPLVSHTAQRTYFRRPWEAAWQGLVRWSDEFSARETMTMASIEPRAPEIPSEKVTIAARDLPPGYVAIHTGFVHTMNKMLIAAFTSPTLASVWLYITQQMLLDSPVAMALAAIAAGTASQAAVTVRRMNTYTHLSTLAHPEQLAAVSDTKKIKAILAGTNPQIQLKRRGIEITGPLGDIDNPSSAQKDALTLINALQRLVIPHCAYTEKGRQRIDAAHHSWLTRFTLPFSIFNVIGILLKNPKKRRAEDNATLAAGMHDLNNYVRGFSVGVSRHKFNKLLRNCETAQEVIEVLVDNKILHEGALSLLNDWIKHQPGVFRVKVNRFGSLVFTPPVYPSWGGPVPGDLYPQNFKKNSGANLVTGLLDMFGIGSKKKSPPTADIPENKAERRNTKSF